MGQQVWPRVCHVLGDRVAHRANSRARPQALDKALLDVQKKLVVLLLLLQRAES